MLGFSSFLRKIFIFMNMHECFCVGVPPDTRSGSQACHLLAVDVVAWA